MKTNKLVKYLIANDISIADLQNWQMENFSRKDYLPIEYGTFQILKSLSNKQIEKALKEMKRLY